MTDKPDRKVVESLLEVHDQVVTPHDHIQTYISCLKELMSREAQKLTNKYESLPDELEGSEVDDDTYDRLLWTDDIVELIEKVEAEINLFFQDA